MIGPGGKGGVCVPCIPIMNSSDYIRSCVQIKRENKIFRMSTSVHRSYVGALARCAPDAVDFYMWLSEEIAKDPKYTIVVNIEDIHKNKMFRHGRNPDEDELFAQIVCDLFRDHGQTFSKFGFPVGEDGEIINHNTITVIPA